MRHPIALVAVVLVLALTGVAQAQDKKCDSQPPTEKKIAAAPHATPHEAAPHWVRDDAGQWRLASEPR